MLQISHREVVQVRACCHEGLCAKTLVGVPWDIWQGLTGHWTIRGKSGVMSDAVVHFTHVQVLLCKMLRPRQQQEMLHKPAHPTSATVCE